MRIQIFRLLTVVCIQLPFTFPEEAATTKAADPGPLLTAESDYIRKDFHFLDRNGAALHLCQRSEVLGVMFRQIFSAFESFVDDLRFSTTVSFVDFLSRLRPRASLTRVP
jgi:hypothetical protein